MVDSSDTDNKKDNTNTSDETDTVVSTTEKNNVESYNNDYEYLWMDVEDKEPDAKDCNSQEERGRFAMQRGTDRIYICNGPDRGWDYVELNDK
jgi:hypothetical protein